MTDIPMIFDCVILADGDFPHAPKALNVLDGAKMLVCCDNAGRALIERSGRVPDAIVGDGDSLPAGFKQKYKNIYHQVSEQEYNDLTKATRFALAELKSKGIEHPRIAYLGTTGKREDHTLGNIGLLNFYRHKFHFEPVFITDYGIFTAHEGNATLESFPRQQVSIFNINCTEMTSEGLKWQSYPYQELWQGTLNEALSDSFTIRSNGQYLIFRTLKPKV